VAHCEWPTISCGMRELGGICTSPAKCGGRIPDPIEPTAMNRQTEHLERQMWGPYALLNRAFELLVERMDDYIEEIRKPQAHASPGGLASSGGGRCDTCGVPICSLSADPPKPCLLWEPRAHKPSEPQASSCGACDNWAEGRCLWHSVPRGMGDRARAPAYRPRVPTWRAWVDALQAACLHKPSEPRTEPDPAQAPCPDTEGSTGDAGESEGVSRKGLRLSPPDGSAQG
jgi:hypothetical protein